MSQQAISLLRHDDAQAKDLRSLYYISPTRIEAAKVQGMKPAKQNNEAVCRNRKTRKSDDNEPMITMSFHTCTFGRMCRIANLAPRTKTEEGKKIKKL